MVPSIQQDLRPGAGNHRRLGQEQSAGVGQINERDGPAQQATQQNASASEELAATAEEMSGQAEQLQELMAFFKLGRATATGWRSDAGRLADAGRCAVGVPRGGAGQPRREANFERF